MDPFGVTVGTGFLPSGRRTRTGPLSMGYLRDGGAFQTRSLPANANLPPVGGPDGANPRVPRDRIAECFGTTNNPAPFLLTDRQINAAKGAIFTLRAPQSAGNLDANLRAAVADPTTDNLNEMFAHVRAVSMPLTPSAPWKSD